MLGKKRSVYSLFGGRKNKKDTFAGRGGVADATALGEAYCFGQADVEGLQELPRGVKIA